MSKIFTVFSARIIKVLLHILKVAVTFSKSLEHVAVNACIILRGIAKSTVRLARHVGHVFSNCLQVQRVNTIVYQISLNSSIYLNLGLATERLPSFKTPRCG